MPHKPFLQQLSEQLGDRPATKVAAGVALATLGLLALAVVAALMVAVAVPGLILYYLLRLPTTASYGGGYRYVGPPPAEVYDPSSSICHACRMPIPGLASVCPHCRTPNP